MNLSFNMDIEDKEGQVPDRSISKLFRCMILHDLKTIVAELQFPACPFPPMPLFRASTLVQGLLPPPETLVAILQNQVLEGYLLNQNLDS